MLYVLINSVFGRDIAKIFLVTLKFKTDLTNTQNSIYNNDNSALKMFISTLVSFKLCYWKM